MIGHEVVLVVSAFLGVLFLNGQLAGACGITTHTEIGENQLSRKGLINSRLIMILVLSSSPSGLQLWLLARQQYQRCPSKTWSSQSAVELAQTITWPLLSRWFKNIKQHSKVRTFSLWSVEPDFKLWWYVSILIWSFQSRKPLSRLVLCQHLQERRPARRERGYSLGSIPERHDQVYSKEVLQTLQWGKASLS